MPLEEPGSARGVAARREVVQGTPESPLFFKLSRSVRGDGDEPTGMTNLFLKLSEFRRRRNPKETHNMKKLFTLLNKLSYRLQRSLNPNDQQKLYNAWFAARGDKTLRLQYQLSHDSVVFDVGGYKGQWAAEIYERYGCEVFVFEPVEQYARAIRERFDGLPRVKVFSYGLGANNRTDTIGIDNDASSLFIHSRNAQEIEIRNVVDFLEIENIRDIDLIKINIEGGEYELLESLLKNGACENIRNLQIQFHNFFPEAEARMTAIQDALSVTHDLTWQYRFIWENWRRKQVLES